MNERNTTHWTNGGNLFGAYRYKDTIMWDQDGDFGYLLTGRTKVVEVVSVLKQLRQYFS